MDQQPDMLEQLTARMVADMEAGADSVGFTEIARLMTERTTTLADALSCILLSRSCHAAAEQARSRGEDRRAERDHSLGQHLLSIAWDVIGGTLSAQQIAALETKH